MEVAFGVLVVREEQVWWPGQGVSMLADELGGVAGPDGCAVEDWALVVETVGVGCEGGEVLVVAFGDGAVLPQVVEVLRTVGEPEFVRW